MVLLLLLLLVLLLFQPCSLSSSFVLSFLMMATSAGTNKNVNNNNNNDYENKNEDKTTITAVESSSNHWKCQDDDDKQPQQYYCQSTYDDDHSSNYNNIECDTNFDLLGKCQKTCMVCYEGQKFPQRDGRGSKISPKTTIDLWKLQRQINLFYNNNNHYKKNNNNNNGNNNHYYKNNLPYYPSPSESCTDVSEDCAMYALKGLCSPRKSNEYKDYVWKHCPRMCQICDIQKFHIFIQKILNPIQNAYYYYNTKKEEEEEEDTTTVMTTTNGRHHRALTVLLNKLNMDPKLLFGYNDQNNNRNNNEKIFVTNEPKNFDENDGNNNLNYNSNDSTSTNFMYELYEKLHMWIPEPTRKMYDPLSSSSSDSSNSSSSALVATKYDIDFLEKLFHIEYENEDNINTNNDDDDTSNNNKRKRRIQNMIENHILIPFRSRGYIVGGDSSIIESLDALLLRPIQLGIGFAIPNDRALKEIQNLHQPIIEVGAGTGYWSNLLYYQYDVDIVAYDIDPPPFLPSSSTSPTGTITTTTTTSTITHNNDDYDDDNNSSCHNSNSQQRQQSTTKERRATTRENAFFDVAYFDKIQKGSCIDVIESYAPDRVLLIIWPNDPDPIDKNDELFFGGGSSNNENDDEEEGNDDDGNENIHHQDQDPSSSYSSYSSSSSQPVWDVDCLYAYIRAGGQTVIYIGERESIIPNVITLNNNQNNYYDNNDDDLAKKQQQRRRRDSGTSSTRKFQQMLEQYMDLVDVINIPSWWLNYDDMTIWKRKKKKEYE